MLQTQTRAAQSFLVRRSRFVLRPCQPTAGGPVTLPSPVARLGVMAL